MTIHLNINFLRHPSPGDLIAEALLMKLGKRLAVSEVAFCDAENDDAIARCTLTYPLPPN